MLKGSGTTSDGRPVLVVGLSSENIRRLQVGQPIYFDMAEVGITGQCLIFTGPSEQAMADALAPMLAQVAGRG